MTVTIHSNGPGNPQPLEALFRTLKTAKLDLELFAQFARRVGGAWIFFGNFSDASHVFNFDVRDDDELAARLRRAIADNVYRQIEDPVTGVDTYYRNVGQRLKAWRRAGGTDHELTDAGNAGD